MERKGSSEGDDERGKSRLFPAFSAGADGTVVFGIRYSVDCRMLN